MWRLVSELAIPPSYVRYATGNDATDWVLSADVMVSMQSNLSVEAMLVGVPAIDMLTEIGTWLGPCFGADSGILEVEPWALSQVLAEVLSSEGAASAAAGSDAARRPLAQHQRRWQRNRQSGRADGRANRSLKGRELAFDPA